MPSKHLRARNNMESIDIDDFFKSIAPKLGPLENMFSMVFKKQVKDMSIGKMMSPKQADELTEKVSSAMEFFAGPKMKKEISRMMRAEIRRRSPEYFRKKYGI